MKRSKASESLAQACEHIARRGLNGKIGIETGSRCYQIPTLQEADAIITNLQDAPVYLWYDIGHAMMMERIGLYENGEALRKLKDKALGVHIHETAGLVDHWCPYTSRAGSPVLAGKGPVRDRVRDLLGL